MMTKDLFFEFAGMPKSGKSTILNTVSHYLQAQGHRVVEYDGSAFFSSLVDADLGSLNMILACKACEFILTSVEEESAPHRIYLLYRGLFDRYIFAEAMLKLGKIDATEAERTVRFLTIPRLVNHITGVFIFITDPQISELRGRQNKLTTIPGRVRNLDFLSSLRTASLETFRKIHESNKNVMLIDTEQFEGEISSCARKVIETISREIIS